MPALWKGLRAEDLNIPIPKYADIEIGGRVMTWLPHMRPQGADWYLISRIPGEIKRYVTDGGDPSKAIIHHLHYDEAVITALWKPNYLISWMKRLKDWGIDKIIMPDFSTWYEIPMVARLHNVYRSCCVANDFAIGGFKVIPIIQGDDPNNCIWQMVWPKDGTKTVLFDLSHAHTKEVNESHYRGVASMIAPKRYGRVLVWARDRDRTSMVAGCGAEVTWQPTRWFMRNELMRQLRKVRGEADKNVTGAGPA